MNLPSQRRWLLVGLSLIVLTNAVVLSAAALNRAGEPESSVLLSERELALPYATASRRSNSGLALHLEWRVATDGDTMRNLAYARYERQPDWLDETRMAGLGFDTRKGAATPEARQAFLRQLSRPALIVFELAGPAWQRALQQARENASRHAAAAAANRGNREFAEKAKAARDFVVQEEAENTRLFAIDAGSDAATLRERYPQRDRFLILRGTVRPAERLRNGQWALAGQLSAIAIQEIHVPYAQRGVLDALRSEPQEKPDRSVPRYEVQLAVGQRLEPWIERVALLPSDARRAGPPRSSN
ncbi:MAG TPA: DUF4824 family protein [Accumulibacter sp.]|uniref:DUF4824 family protein n=1 Tax=Accumulibacter sp. TaxID=2053492 RepID=UPI00287AA2FD|nr:DUF4824 family protein [Accumulibacter sp.]MDS4055772.1 DUF4824 family protein [Accumulibacter sp.]HMV04694.1 DUF4824 family protein [Accumulibacter sp.]HMW62236.1 DUF4824 family protein [Accumulibacter sp.]HMW79308.1 DUF4824 family protein [Accumulibacter sp.]HMX69883.1 DUF4824 family protein [Accumulibacter sp.]